jgi:hypothetical protein
VRSSTSSTSNNNSSKYEVGVRLRVLQRHARGGSGTSATQNGDVFHGRAPAPWHADAPAGRAPLVARVFGPVRDVADGYWRVAAWWAAQGVAASALQVLATSALLTSLLGVAAAPSMALSAAINWVLKDGFGSLGLMLVSTKYGSLFDVYPKRAKFVADCLLVSGVAVCRLSTVVVLVAMVEACSNTSSTLPYSQWYLGLLTR